MTDRPKRIRPAPFSLRLTQDERARLELAATGTSLGTYVKERLFGSSLPAPRRRGKFPVKDHQALSQLLGLLGQSRLSSNLNQLARASNTGTLALTPDVEADLQSAARQVAEMRALLVQALGLEDA